MMKYSLCVILYIYLSLSPVSSFTSTYGVYDFHKQRIGSSIYDCSIQSTTNCDISSSRSSRSLMMTSTSNGAAIYKRKDRNSNNQFNFLFKNRLFSQCVIQPLIHTMSHLWLLLLSISSSSSFKTNFDRFNTFCTKCFITAFSHIAPSRNNLNPVVSSSSSSSNLQQHEKQSSQHHKISYLQNKNHFSSYKMGIAHIILSIGMSLGLAIKPSFAYNAAIAGTSKNPTTTITKVLKKISSSSSSSKRSADNNMNNKESSSSSSSSSKSNDILVLSNSHASNSGSNSHTSPGSTASSNNKRKPTGTKTTASKTSVSGSNQHTILDVEEYDNEAVVEVKSTFKTLIDSLQGAKLDSLILLLVTSAVVPIFKRINVSPIVGFLLAGTLMGPTGFNWVKDIHVVDIIGELGIVFFLFEMGLELSLERLKSMRRDVFGLGTCQFFLTAAAGAGVSLICGLPTAAAVTIGGSLALSSSAFVLELLKDKKALGTRHGKASFGILLFQDLAVVPLLVVVELVSKGGAGLFKALSIAGMKAIITLTTMSFAGRSLLNPIFYFVAKSNSQEAFLSIILSTVLLMSFVTKGVGLSDTLGAFLAGLLLSETKFRYQIESDIAPFRGLLLGIFFITVGFSIDLNVILKETPTIIAMIFTLIAGKASIITGLSMLFGMPFSSAQQCGLLNAQGGEFAFVAFGIAERAGLISKPLTKKLLTTVALSMALTPLLADMGSFFSAKLEEKMDFARVTHQDVEIEKNEEFVLVCGYGRVGKMVCEMLDQNLIKYIAVDNRPKKAIEARSLGLPVFFGDISRPEVLKNFDASNAKACVVALSDMTTSNKVVSSLRKLSSTLPIIVRAKDETHRKRLESMFEGVYAMSPMLPEDSVLLSLPFGGVVLQKIGVSKPEIDAILNDFRVMYMEGNTNNKGSTFSGADDTFDFLDTFSQRLPPSEQETVLIESEITELDEGVEGGLVDDHMNDNHDDGSYDHDINSINNNNNSSSSSVNINEIVVAVVSEHAIIQNDMNTIETTSSSSSSSSVSPNIVIDALLVSSSTNIDNSHDGEK